ncbi:MAG: UDP-N-acetylglucosamine 1-carboxyvinyltransferase [Firmicutes bacterium]|nr:UDP-N-acetylglucosamine 1-carboxyvinyltransferase [Bacillota bacterium]
MKSYVVKGGRPLEGKVDISGAKNAVLPIMAASLMARSPVLLQRVPRIHDVDIMLEMLEALGAACSWEDAYTLRISPPSELGVTAPEKLLREMRASILVVGPLLAREGKAIVTPPGGCNIGPRPIDFHLKGMEALGAEIVEGDGQIVFTSPRLTGAEVMLDYPSVGATENIMCAACTASGKTVIHNAAKEPEIIELQNFLNLMGARVKGAGTDRITVYGVEELHGTEYTVIPDRIEAGTYLIAGAITGGDVLIQNVIIEHLESTLAKLAEMGYDIQRGSDSVRIKAARRGRAIGVRSMPYPGFPTDMLPQMISLLSLAEGVSMVYESVFASRFKHVDDLIRMGAQIRTEGRLAIITGVDRLRGTTVRATDLRAGAALILASLAAKGQTTVENGEHIDRGYEDVVGKLRGIGVEITES